MRSALDWFSGLNIGQKGLAVLFGGLLRFSVIYLVTSGVLWLLFASPEGPTQESGASHSQQASAPGRQFATPPGMDLQITRAEWVRNTVEVEGRWGGEISSVHCDLFEGGGKEKRVIDWWDRSVAPTMSWLAHTFRQRFVEAKGAKESIDPSAEYSVICLAAFADGWSTNDSAPVRGEPSG
jgi:hypothetical protein